MKVLFTIRDCSFLISVSENAWMRFVRQGLPIRDVFDSSLDTLIRLDHLSLREARSLARHRERGLSDAQVALAYCLSGGLPRDLLRMTWAIGEINAELGGGTRLSGVADLLLRRGLQVKADAALLASLSTEDPAEVPRLIADLQALREEPVRSAWLPWCPRLLREDDAFARLVTGPSVVPSTPAPAVPASLGPLRPPWPD